MVAYLIGILAFVIILYLNLVVSNKLLYPPVLFSLIWMIVLALHFVNATFEFGIEIFPLKHPTIIFLIVMNILFSLASFLAYTGTMQYSLSRVNISKKQSYPSQYEIDKLFFEILNLLSIICAFFFFQKAFQLTSSYELGPFIKELRTILNYHDGSFGWIKYTVVIININFFVRLILINKVKQKTSGIVIAFLIAIGVAILNTGRTYIFFILIFAFSYWLFTKRIRFKKLLLAGFVMIFFFSLLGFLTEKGADMEADWISNISSMFQSFMEYLLGPVTAFQELLQSNEPLQYGKYSFRFIHKLLFEIRLLDSPPVDLVQQFRGVPFPTNVYTVFSPYYKDFGIAGAAVFMILVGGVYGILYYLSRINRLFFQYLFLLLIYPLLMSFFADFYFSMLSSWIQYIIFSTLVFGLFVYRIRA